MVSRRDSSISTPARPPGTGKSTSVKALINEYYDQGLRMIEIYKHQFGELSFMANTPKPYCR